MSRKRKSMHDPPSLTYPADVACQVSEILGIQRLIDLKKWMGTEHLPLHERRNRVPILRDFAHSFPDSEVKSILRSRVREVEPLIALILNNPTFEAFKVLEVSGLPKQNTVIFSSAATANSGNDDACTSALRILGWCSSDKGIVYKRSSTCTQTGKTGKSNVNPKNSPVYYNSNTPPEKWHDLSFDLAAQFFALSNGPPDKSVVHCYDHIYHWGCIHRNFLENQLGRMVTSWTLHEKWNIIMTMAMMWHGVMTLKPGGQLCIKVRIFKRAETLGLVSLIACLFDSVKMVDNPRQVCTFVSVIYSGMTDDDVYRKKVADTLKDAMDQSVEKIFLNEIQVTDPKCRAALTLASQHQESMIRARAESNTLYLVGLFCLKQLMLYRERFIDSASVDSALRIFSDQMKEKYGTKDGTYFVQYLIDTEGMMDPKERHLTLRVLDSEWMNESF